MSATCTLPPLPVRSIIATRPVLADQGYFAARLATLTELREIIADALSCGDLRICDHCCRRLTTDRHTAPQSGDTFSLCDDCADTRFDVGNLF
ncbi:hypothetical protein [Planomonospora sp. ID82291]|uniref:hypothetical protein n=1 Tax=Planomonospora sp. ID82291 TaxID=2738136 RepID=UPI0018C36B14|nr:hypothetical protein [Planomonospora sp. ID82291]MBG0818445.1 hypothetical protein [Planomonospora sp. ID82291]